MDQMGNKMDEMGVPTMPGMKAQEANFGESDLAFYQVLFGTF
jgi:hypothetical protein